MILSLALAVAAASQPIHAGLEARVPHAPQMVERSDGARLSYEVHLASFSRRPMRLIGMDVVDADTGQVVARLDERTLPAFVGGQWVPAEVTDRGTIAPGGRAVLFLDTPVTGQPPRRIAHRIRYAAGDAAPVEIAAPAVAVLARKPLELGPPLKGGPWTAAYSPDLEFGHRRFVYSIDGVARVPGRVAIDFFHAARPERPTRYAEDPGFGAEVLAVADGTVVALRDDVSDPDQRGDTPIPLADAAGNFVALDLGDGRTAFFEHLRRGVRLKLGQRVRRGQVIGAVGATGQVGGTHLHFHLGDTRDPLRTEGTAYRFTRFEQVGQFASIHDVGKRDWTRGAARTIEHALPAPNVVVRFAE